MPTSPYGRIAYAHGVWALPIHGIASRSLWATIITVMIIAGGAIMAGVCDTPVRGVIMGSWRGSWRAYAIRPYAVMIMAGGAIMAGVCDTPVRGVIMGFMAGIVAAYAIRPCAA